MKLSEKGVELRQLIDDMFARHLVKIGETDLDEETFAELNQTLKLLERFWERETQFSGLSGLSEF